MKSEGQGQPRKLKTDGHGQQRKLMTSSCNNVSMHEEKIRQKLDINIKKLYLVQRDPSKKN